MQEITTKLCIIIGQFGVFWFEFVFLAFLKTKCIKQCQPQHWIFKDYFLNKSYLVFIYETQKEEEGREGGQERDKEMLPSTNSLLQKTTVFPAWPGQSGTKMQSRDSRVMVAEIQPLEAAVLPGAC